VSDRNAAMIRYVELVTVVSNQPFASPQPTTAAAIPHDRVIPKAQASQNHQVAKDPPALCQASLTADAKTAAGGALPVR
jgi:hypothetical protein